PSSLLVAISSPYAKRGALFEAHRAHFGKENDPVLVWQAPTAAMNPTIDQAIIEEAYATDPSAAKAEYGALFRDDIESFLSSAWIDAVTVPGRYEVAPQTGYYYVAATDASGGAGGDAFTVGIAHPEGRGSEKKIVLDVLKGWWPRGGDSDLEAIVREIAALLMRFSLRVIHGDRYSSHWIIEAFRREGIRYEEPRVRSLSDPDTTTYLDKSGAYAEIEPLIATRHVELLDHPVMLREMKSLERRLRSGGKTVIDHAPGAHDDHANAAALAIALAAAKAGIRPAYAAVNDGIRRIGEPSGGSGLGAVVGGGQTARAAAGVI